VKALRHAILIGKQSLGPLLAVAILASNASAKAPSDLTPEQVREDFRVFCAEIQSTYAYFDVKATRWDEIAALYDRDVRQVRTRDELIGVLERAMNELYDDHAQLTVNTSTSPMLVPSGTDVWAEWVGTEATVTAVRHESDAERAGMRPGTVVVSVNGYRLRTHARRSWAGPYRGPIQPSATGHCVMCWQEGTMRRGVSRRHKAGSCGDLTCR
jgi:hypothetical protein